MSWTNAAVEEQVAAIFQDELKIDVPSPKTDLLGTGTLDSLMLVELLLQLERRFGLRVDLDALEIDDFRSVEAVAAFVARRRPPGD